MWGVGVGFGVVCGLVVDFSDAMWIMRSKKKL